MALVFWALFLCIGLFTFDSHDPSLNQTVSRGYQIQNSAGLPGAIMSGSLVDLFGMVSFVWPILFLYLGITRFTDRLRMPWWRWSGISILVLCLMVCLSLFTSASITSAESLRGGGFFGRALLSGSVGFLSGPGSLLFWLFIFLAGIQLATGATWSGTVERVRDYLIESWREYEVRIKRRLAEREGRLGRDSGTAKPRRASRKSADPASPETMSEQEEFEFPQLDVETFRELEPIRLESGPIRATTDQPKGSDQPPAKPKPPKPAPGKTELPPLDYLFQAPPASVSIKPEMLQAQANRLVECLGDFGVQGEIQKVLPGPVVTMFEYKPAAGIKISKIAGLSDDLALALKAMAVRIEAPIPGKDTVGVEIPNEHRQTVYLREILESDTFQSSTSKLTIALGKDIQGQPRVADLAKMPHLLVAGATGAGKSVCLNGILLSFLYKATPEEVKLLLVDPKRIELSAYANMPHLVHPVVTDMALAKNALDWAVYEMDKRYESMARLGVRNIDGFNQKLESFGKNKPEEFADLEKMPFLVIVIDELADLMMTAAKEVEMSIVRLAQLARAAGIHLILATQRPSVDVVTGLIKANFPSRISFQVTSKHDSRTILDMVGAEHLLGRGDMLYKPSGSKLQRLHGAYVSEEEIALIVEYWHAQRPPSFDLDFTSWKGEVKGEGAEGEGEDIAGDPMYSEAVEFVVGQGKASISLIQRRFRIGFNRAARYIEQMERDGLLGPQEGSKPRCVLRSKE